MSTTPSAHADAAPLRDGILLTSNFSNVTGYAWKYFHRLQNVIAREMHRRGLAVHASFAKIEGEVRTIDADILAGVVQFNLGRHTAAECRAFLRYLRDHRIRYVYFTDFGSWSRLFPMMRLAGARRLIVHSHVSVARPYLPPTQRGLKGAVKAAMHRLPWLSADSIYACSDFVKQRFVRLYRCPAERIAVIHHGIELERFAASERPDRTGPVNVVLIARAVREKGVDVLLRAAAELRRSGQVDFHITYGGDGPELTGFRMLADELGIADKVTFVGHVANTDAVLRDADIVVVPSNWGDAAPLSVLEGMASGCPLVVTDVGGIPEQIGYSGCAIVIPPGNPQALAAALRELITDPERRCTMGRLARRHVEANFSEERFHQEVVSHLLKDCSLN